VTENGDGSVPVKMATKFPAIGAALCGPMEGVAHTPTLNGLHSEDGRWWWDGDAWLPAYSFDGRRWWNGVSWIPVTAPRTRVWLSRPPRWLLVVCTVWLLAILVPWVVAFVTHPADKHLSAGAGVALAIGDGAVTIIAGALTAFDGYPWRRLPVLVGAAGVLLTLVLYIATNPTGQNSDPQGAPLGYAVAFVAIGVAALLLLSAGVAIGLTIGRGLRLASARSRVS
jgi:4-amino-4-deoxy-L-arabinose transferase-like glycosyltransferase